MLGVPSAATRNRMRVRPSGSLNRNTADLSGSRSIDARACSFMGYLPITVAMAFCFSGPSGIARTVLYAENTSGVSSVELLSLIW